jgi:hypothetical protein
VREPCSDFKAFGVERLVRALNWLQRVAKRFDKTGKRGEKQLKQPNECLSTEKVKTGKPSTEKAR